jgi:hypothetical protein
MQRSGHRRVRITVCRPGPSSGLASRVASGDRVAVAVAAGPTIICRASLKRPGPARKGDPSSPAGRSERLTWGRRRKLRLHRVVCLPAGRYSGRLSAPRTRAPCGGPARRSFTRVRPRRTSVILRADFIELAQKAKDQAEQHCPHAVAGIEAHLCSPHCCLFRNDR